MSDKDLIPINDITGETAPRKRKKYYIKQWLMLIMLLITVFAVKSCIGLGANIGTEKIDWSKLILSNKLPDPKIKRGKIYENSHEKLWLNMRPKKDEKDSKYNDYLIKCMEMGYTVEPLSTSYSYEAHNAEGYKLKIYNSYRSVDIELDKPIVMGELAWASGELGKVLPKPKSNVGKLMYEYNDNFAAYVGETPKSEYDAYVKACMDAGFTVEYDKNDRYFNGTNKDGWRISADYQGNGIMHISIYKSSDNS